MALSIRHWIRISIISFLIVAVLGVLMRYKIPFSLPALHQKNLLHAHSHFAFTGWITQTLYVLLIHFLQKQPGGVHRRYNYLLIGNLVVCYGMLFSFTAQGYGAVSITFATLSIIVNYIFCTACFIDLNKMAPHPSKNWIRASLLFSVLSSLGTFYLAYMMYSKSVDQNHYLGALYFFLHFQYNGWFTFASMGLLVAWLHQLLPHVKISITVFRLFFWACVPAYFLSTLWANLPVWLYVLTVLAAIAQVVGWGIFIKQMSSIFNQLKQSVNRIGGFILLLAGFAFSIKLLLQLGSTVPAISKLAFGFRPIVIAYLHLILLAVFSLYLLAYSYAKGFMLHNKTTIAGLIIITFGVFLNEFVLLIQGVAAFSYTAIPYVNEILLAVAATILAGVIVLLASQFSGKTTATVTQEM